MSTALVEHARPEDEIRRALQTIAPGLDKLYTTSLLGVPTADHRLCESRPTLADVRSASTAFGRIVRTNGIRGQAELDRTVGKVISGRSRRHLKKMPSARPLQQLFEVLQLWRTRLSVTTYSLSNVSQVVLAHSTLTKMTPCTS